MPDLPQDAIQDLINSGKLDMLSIDTTVFDRSQNRLEHGLLSNLSQFSNLKVEFVLSDIVIGEVTSHMESATEKTDTRLKEAVKNIAEIRNIDVNLFESAIDKTIGHESPKKITKRRIKNFKDKTNATIINARDYVIVDNLVSSYFEVNPPFDMVAKKKNEFPDAMALHSLEAYAKGKQKMMLVVSADAGWKSFCRESEQLVCEENLGIAMGYFQSIPRVAESTMLKRREKFDIHINDELMKYIKNMNIRTSTKSEYGVVPTCTASYRDFAYNEEKPFILINHDEKNSRYVFAANILVDIFVHATFQFYIRSEGRRIEVGISDMMEQFSQIGSIMLTVKSSNLNEDIDVKSTEIIYIDNNFDFGKIEPEPSVDRIS